MLCYKTCVTEEIRYGDNDKLAAFDGMNLSQETFSLPCEEMSLVSFRNLMVDGFDFNWLQIAYPAKVKIITQQEAIDIHALIGNIGGYIGLILGLFKNYQ